MGSAALPGEGAVERRRRRMHRVYVIGHRQPDTDSICSVLAYAELLNHGEPDRYVLPAAAT